MHDQRIEARAAPWRQRPWRQRRRRAHWRRARTPSRSERRRSRPAPSASRGAARWIFRGGDDRHGERAKPCSICLFIPFRVLALAGQATARRFEPFCLMPTLLLTHPDCLLHDMGHGHPERPDRLRAIEDALAAPAFNALKREQAPLADLAVIERAPPARYVEAIRAASPQARSRLARSRHRDVAPRAGMRRCAPPAPRSTPSTRS